LKPYKIILFWHLSFVKSSKKLAQNLVILNWWKRTKLMPRVFMFKTPFYYETPQLSKYLMRICRQFSRWYSTEFSKKIAIFHDAWKSYTWNATVKAKWNEYILQLATNFVQYWCSKFQFCSCHRFWTQVQRFKFCLLKLEFKMKTFIVDVT
jgi:hypothetical protein